MSASLDEIEVLERNRAFYTAFRRRDMATMESIWAQSAKVACIHPGWQAIRGRGEVLASLRAILSQEVVPRIRCEDVSVHLVGDAAFVICEEVLREGRLVATNIFVRENGDWRLLHHQAGPMAPHVEDDDEDELSPDAADGETGDDLDEPGLMAFSGGPLALGWSAPVRDLAADVSDVEEDTDPDAEPDAEPDAAADSEDDDEAMGPGPLFHSPDEPLSDPAIPGLSGLSGAPGSSGVDDGEHGSYSHPGLETRPISEIAELGDRTHPASRPARRLIN
jgi:ketosteroid isomerase-like protein